MKKGIILFSILFITCFNMFGQVNGSSDPNIWTKIYPDQNPKQEDYTLREWVSPNPNPMQFYLDDGALATILPNFRIKPGTGSTQSEMSIDMHPTMPSIIFAGANATNWPYSTIYGTGTYFSTDGGTTWGGFDDPQSYYGRNSGDPAAIIGPNGNFYMGFINNSSGQSIAVSTNYGTSWTSYTVAPNPGTLLDKNHLMVDKLETSPYVNRVYDAYTPFGGTNNYKLELKYSSNFGQTWSSGVNISTGLASSYLDQGVNIQTGPNGVVYAAWAVYIDNSVSTGEDGIGFNKSTDGGQTWGTPIFAYQVSNFGIRGNLTSKNNIRVSSFPSMAVNRTSGEIYITFPQKANITPCGNSIDIVMIKSTNGGTTWSAPVRVNDDPLNNSKDQYYPWMTIDQSSGNLFVVFYDSRNVANDSAEVYVARSNDGGVTFQNFKVSDAAFKPIPISGLASGYQGDYIGIAAVNNIVFPLWADNRTGNYQGWSTKIIIGPDIQHTGLTNTENKTGPYAINCIINPAGSGINPSRTKLYWSRNSTTAFDSITMTNTTGNNWTASIPGNGQNAIYRYYIMTFDSLNQYGLWPAGAPSVPHMFVAATDTVKPVITHTPLLDVPRLAWPATVTATVTDNIGVDSVWVKWYKNSTTTGIKHFRLNNSGANVFAALFNSDTNQVAYDDSIFYKIYARDNSSQHNVDSTALYKFKIVAIANATIGTGTTAVGWPYYTYYHDSRTQMLYLASEILAGGGSAGAITRIGFNVVSAASQVMNGFYIRMKNTNITSLTAWETGFTDVYSGTYTVPGTGWQTIDLMNPFIWDGTSNLLIEICFDNTSYTSNTTVNSSTTTATLNRHYHMDNGTGCTMTSTSTAATRPNVYLQFNLSLVPVELTSFTANADNNNVQIKWSTASEKNNSGFEIQRRSEDGTYSKIGFVSGNGTSTEVKNYSYTDKNLMVGKYTYRLRQIDYDGTYTYTNEINVEVDPPKVFALEQNYPNPFNPNTSIKYSIAKDGLVNISIYNALGEKVGVLVNEIQKAGNYDVTFNAKQFASGVYFYRMESGNFTSIKKMILIK